MKEEHKKIYMKICKYDKEPKEVIINLMEKLEEDEAVIEEMAKYIGNLDTDEDICKEVEIASNELGECEITCKDCVINFFRNKVKENEDEN